MPNLGDVGVGLFLGFIVGAVTYYLCADWLGCFQGRVDTDRVRTVHVDDRALAVRTAPWWARHADAVRTGTSLPRVQQLRPHDGGLGGPRGHGLGAVTATTPEQAHADRETERRARFVRDLAAKGQRISELTIEDL